MCRRISIVACLHCDGKVILWLYPVVQLYALIWPFEDFLRQMTISNEDFIHNICTVITTLVLVATLQMGEPCFLCACIIGLYSSKICYWLVCNRLPVCFSMGPPKLNNPIQNRFKLERYITDNLHLTIPTTYVYGDIHDNVLQIASIDILHYCTL